MCVQREREREREKGGGGVRERYACVTNILRACALVFFPSSLCLLLDNSIVLFPAVFFYCINFSLEVVTRRLLSEYVVGCSS